MPTEVMGAEQRDYNPVRMGNFALLISRLSRTQHQLPPDTATNRLLRMQTQSELLD